jgi:hypothetical protein
VIEAVADLLVSAAALALSVTSALAGAWQAPCRLIGAPLEVIVGLTVPHVGEQFVPF